MKKTNLLSQIKTQVKKELAASYKLYPSITSSLYANLKNTDNIMNANFFVIKDLVLLSKTADINYIFTTAIK